MKVPATIETTKTLEQRITQEYLDGPWSKSTYYMSDDEGSDIIDMSVKPPVRENPQTQEIFDIDDEDPSFNPSSDNEPLDWGSDPEEYVTSSPTSTLVHNLTALPQLQSEQKLKDGCFNYAVDTILESICEHGSSYAVCSRCKGKQSSKMGTRWLLDSGASAHFTFDKNDFINYTPATPQEKTPVKTAAHTIYVEGKGTVLIKHLVGDELVTTRLHPVLHIPNISTRLLSMGEFLQQGLRVHGNAHEICLDYKRDTLMTCKPLRDGQTTYWLDATISNVEKFAEQNIYMVDYDLMHKRLGHPSKDVMSHARDQLNGFPKSVTIPSNSPVCPGCAQGKMPASAHPPSETRASAPFERIHSDLKSFPVVSYHKYRYFVSFIDDFTSYAWIVLLRDKASAITALKQFMAMVTNQYNTHIKEWMSDAGGEYKSDAFIRTLKDAGIKILQSAPHTPQQNGRAERFMRTVMDKAQAMRLEACIPQSWWEFAVLHATHCYNRTPVRRLKWETPYTALNRQLPDISHLRVFGCGAYVHIPKETRSNALSPKSELMVYLGHTEGIKAYTFMRTTNNTLFTSTTALFDETLFPKCDTARVRGTTRVRLPPASQPPFDASEDTTPGDFDDPLPSKKESKVPLPDEAPAVPDPEPAPAPAPAPPPVPEPVPLRRSA